jgi:rhomboid protease GluP
VLYGCSALYVLSLVLTVSAGGNLFSGSIFSMLGPNQYSLLVLGASGAWPVFGVGRWWTVLSAGWLHGGALHILFNMMFVRQLGPSVADMYGAARMIIIYTIAGATGFLLSSFMGAYFPIPILGGGYVTIGASAPIFGLLGALVYYGRRGGSRHVGSEALGYALTMGVFGIIMPGIDNAAHLGGFGGGYLAGMWLDPLKRERMDHFVGAGVCLLATALSIVWSIVTVYVPRLR